MIHDTQSAQIWQNQDERNIYAIMKTMCPPVCHHKGFVTTHVFITPLMLILVLSDLSTLCVVDHLEPLMHIYVYVYIIIYYIYIYIYIYIYDCWLIYSDTKLEQTLKWQLIKKLNFPVILFRVQSSMFFILIRYIFLFSLKCKAECAAKYGISKYWKFKNIKKLRSNSHCFWIGYQYIS